MLKSKGMNHQDRWFTPFFRLQYVSLLTAYVSKAADCQRMVEKTVEKWGHLDYSDTKIRVNSIAPGTVHTAMTAPVFDDQTPGSFGQQLKKMLPAKRYGEPQEIGQAAYFLASDNVSYINGAVLVADACGSVGTKD